MLRRLTAGSDLRPLKVLLSATEPVKGYKRYAQRKHYQYSPLTRVVDAASPDAPLGWSFNQSVNEYLSALDENPPKSSLFFFTKSSTKQKASDLRKTLSELRANHSGIQKTIEKSPALREIESLSESLAQISVLGIEAIDILERGKQTRLSTQRARESLYKSF